MFSIDDYDFDLPEDLIAQEPVTRRDRSRLLVLDRRDGGTDHRIFSELPTYLASGDVLVVNNTRVYPGRIYGKKASGGRIECLILDMSENGGNTDSLHHTVAGCLIRASKPCRPGSTLCFDEGLRATVVDGADGRYRLAFTSADPLRDVLERIGQVPLPPYIRRDPDRPAPCEDKATYQTVYASRTGAIAAPTAGLHFTPELLGAIVTMGVEIVEITLHVGYGTFSPVRVTDIREHRMHAETYTVSADAAARINVARERGSRVVAVGTTSIRTLEHCADDDGRVAPGSGDCALFIYPGYRFKVVDRVITNFHLPKSTLMMLVSAFAGRDTVLSAYREAVARRYRFFSYGDAMLIC